MSLPSIFVEIGAKIDGFEKAMGDVSAGLRSIDKDASKAFESFDRIGQRLTGLGASLSIGITAPLLAVGAAAGSMAKDFDLATREVNSLLGKAADNQSLAEFRKGILDLSTSMGVDAVQATKALYEAISAGIPKDNAIEFLAVASKTAIAGITSTKVAVDGLTTVINAYGLKAKDATEISDAMFTAVNIGKFRFEELASTLATVVPVAASLGIGYKDILATAATLTTQGFSLSEAMTSIRATIVALLTPNKTMNLLFKDMHVQSGQALIANVGLQGAMQALRLSIGGTNASIDDNILKNQGMSAALDQVKKANQGNIGTLVEALGRVEGLGAVLGVTGDKAAVAAVHLKQVGTSAGDMDAAFQQVNASTSRQFEITVAQLSAIGIKLGQSLTDAILPFLSSVVTPLIGFLKNLVDAFTELPKPVQAAAIAFLAVVAAIGPILLVMGQLIIAASAVGGAFTFLSGAIIDLAAPAVIGGLTVAIAGISTALRIFALETVPTAILATSALASTMLSQAATSFVTLATVSIPAAIAALVAFATTAIPAAIAGVTELALTSIPAAIAGFTSMATGGIAAAATALYGFATGAVAAAASAISTLALTVLPLLGVAATAAAAVFIGWKIGEIALAQIPGVQALGNAMGDLILKIPGVTAAIGYLTGATAAQESANDGLKVSIAKLEQSLRAHGVTVDKTGKSDEEYAAALREAAKHTTNLGTETNKANPYLAAIAKNLKAATGGSEDLGKAHKSLLGHTIKLIDKDEILGAKIQILTAEHHKLVNEVAAYQLAVAKGTDATRDISTAFVDVGDKIDRAQQKLNTLAKITVPSYAAEIGKIKIPHDELQEALKKLGIKSTDTYVTMAKEAAKARDAVLGSDTATDFEKKSAIYKALEAQLELSKVLGEKIPADQTALLDKLGKELDLKTKTFVKPWEDFSKSVSTVITNFAQDISKDLWDGDVSWGEKGMKLLKGLGAAVTSLFVEPATKAITTFITTTLSELLSGKGLGGVLQNVKDLGTELSKVFKIGGSAADAASKVPGSVPDVGNIGGDLGGAAGAAGGGVTDIVGAVAGVVSAVSGVISNFQFAAMNKSLDLIENYTRYAKGYLLQLVETGQNLYLAELPSIQDLIAQFIDQHAWRIHDVWERLGILIDLTKTGTQNLVVETNVILRRMEDSLLRMEDGRVLSGSSAAGNITINISGNADRSTIDYAIAQVSRNLR